MKTIIITMALAGIAFAYDLPKPPTSAGDLAARLAAKITPEQRAGFWRAQAEWISVSTQAQAAKAKLDAIRAELARVCGAQQLISGPDGEPTCSLEPATTRPACQAPSVSRGLVTRAKPGRLPSVT